MNYAYNTAIAQEVCNRAFGNPKGVSPRITEKTGAQPINTNFE